MRGRGEPRERPPTEEEEIKAKRAAEFPGRRRLVEGYSGGQTGLDSIRDPHIAHSMANAEAPSRDKRRFGGLLGPSKKVLEQGSRAGAEVEHKFAEAIAIRDGVARVLREVVEAKNLQRRAKGKEGEYKVDVQDDKGNYSVEVIMVYEKGDYGVAAFTITPEAPGGATEIQVYQNGFSPAYLHSGGRQDKWKKYMDEIVKFVKDYKFLQEKE